MEPWFLSLSVHLSAPSKLSTFHQAVQLEDKRQPQAQGWGLHGKQDIPPRRASSWGQWTHHPGGPLGTPLWCEREIGSFPKITQSKKSMVDYVSYSKVSGPLSQNEQKMRLRRRLTGEVWEGQPYLSGCRLPPPWTTLLYPKALLTPDA